MGRTSLLLIAAIVCSACSRQRSETLFAELNAERSGIDFQNTVIQDNENNVLNYPYYFNGGGVAVGDINNDGLADVYFSGNMAPNRLYINEGDLRFKDVTARAGVGAESGWKTGVTMADVNQDGWLDIYVCRSAMGDSVLRKNLLYINNGDMTFSEQADQFGLADNSYSTHAAFFDYDLDNDLDLFVLNHSLPQYAGFSNLLASYKKQKGSKFHSKLFQNDHGLFHDVSAQAGIINNVLSFGLGLAVSDVNNDGWPDIYVSNDFNEEDYLYINNSDGTFTNAVRDAMGHVSLFSMGSDIADVNNDALPDIFTLDMLPETNERIKLSSGDDNHDKYRILLGAGFHHQSMRNMLQLNNGDGTFSEIGQLSGISSTDWSWSALFCDFDGDGWKDLFVTNGYEKDYTNMQFLKFTVDERIKARQTGARPNIKMIIDQMPSIEVGNYLFKNNGDLTFAKRSAEWGITRAFKSNGAACADLDNDGDPDLVINTMNSPAVVYRNNAVDHHNAVFLTIDLQKNNPKTIITGTQIYVYHGDSIQYYEFQPVRGFQSSMYVPVKVGLNRRTTADSIRIVWPDRKTQLFSNVTATTTFAPRYHRDLKMQTRENQPLALLTPANVLEWKHEPAEANDFKRQVLLPRLYSESGPKMASADVNADRLADVYICGPRGQAGALFLQQRNGTFRQTNAAAFVADKHHQDEDAIFFDADADGDPDLYIVSGGYSFEQNDPLLQDRLYMNDGAGNFTRSSTALPSEVNAGSCIEALDLDGDQDIDLFIGGRVIPGQYPIAAKSMLLINDGKGNFTNEINQRAENLEDAGMICDAVSVDLNRDGRRDLVVTGEWMPLKIMINEGTSLKDETAGWIRSSTNGFWNCVASGDFDGDGDDDLVAGNYGLNSQLKASSERPVTLVYKDFNSDGQVDPFLCYYINGASYPYASRDEALAQVSFLKNRFPDYTSYSNSTLETIFTADELKGATVQRADLLKTVYLENKGSNFEQRDLPIQAQFAPVYAIAPFDIDMDGDLDMVMAGNESNVRVRVGKSDANKGFVFLNGGKGNFSYVSQEKSGLKFDGDVRELLFMSSAERILLLASSTREEIRSYARENKNIRQ